MQRGGHPGLCRWSAEVDARLKWAAAHLPRRRAHCLQESRFLRRQCPGEAPGGWIWVQVVQMKCPARSLHTKPVLRHSNHKEQF